MMQPKIVLARFRWSFPLWAFAGIPCVMIIAFGATTAL
jgi:hypothetical protein